MPVASVLTKNKNIMKATKIWFLDNRLLNQYVLKVNKNKVFHKQVDYLIDTAFNILVIIMLSNGTLDLIIIIKQKKK